MYRLKVTGNYNLVIKDLGISINAASTKEVLVEKQKLDASVDAQRLIANKLLIIVDTDSTESNESVVDEFSPNTDAIVIRKEEEKLPENVFVRQPEEIKAEDAIEEPKGAKVFEPVEVVEVVNESQTETSETKEIVENTQEKEVVAEKTVAPKKVATNKKSTAKAKK